MKLYYVYALKDPRGPIAKPFYVGKGTGARAWSHELNIDNSSKGRRIAEIKHAGEDVLVEKLVEDLTWDQAVKIEAELIAALGTEDRGGLLTNVVSPSGSVSTRRKSPTIPTGVVEKAQIGLGLVKSAVYEFARANRMGVTNADVANSLGLQSEHMGGSINYLSYSVLGLLMRDLKVKYVDRRYKAVHPPTAKG